MRTRPKALMRPRKLLAVSVLLPLCAAGCGYHLVRTRGATVCVLPLSNRTSQPRIEQAVTDGLRRAVLSSPDFRLVSAPEQADLTVSGDIVRFEREPIFRTPTTPSRIAVARFSLEVEISVSGRREMRRTVTETIAVPLAAGYAEDETLTEVGSRAGTRILNLLREGDEQEKH